MSSLLRCAQADTLKTFEVEARSTAWLVLRARVTKTCFQTRLFSSRSVLRSVPTAARRPSTWLGLVVLHGPVSATAWQVILRL